MHTDSTSMGSVSCEDEERDQGFASISQGTPETASKLPEARREARNRDAFSALRRDRPYQHLDSGLLASRSVRQHISIVEAARFMILFVTTA